MLPSVLIVCVGVCLCLCVCQRPDGGPTRCLSTMPTPAAPAHHGSFVSIQTPCLALQQNTHTHTLWCTVALSAPDQTFLTAMWRTSALPHCPLSHFPPPVDCNLLSALTRSPMDDWAYVCVRVFLSILHDLRRSSAFVSSRPCLSSTRSPQ